MKYLVALLILTYSCAPKATTVAEQRTEVMNIHDKAMAKLGDIGTYVTALKKVSKTSADSSEVKSVINELEAAEEGMMIWMQEYNEPAADQLKTFYNSEKIKIQKVADAIYKSIENAKLHLKK